MPAAHGQLLPRDDFEAWASRGALFAGSPQEIIDKILWEHELLGHDRFLAQIGLGGLPFADTAHSIEVLATEVLPVVRRETAAKQPARLASCPSADGGENAARRPDQGNDVAMTRSHHIRHHRAVPVNRHRPKAS